MNTHKTKMTAALNGAGNQQQPMVNLWIVFFKQPENCKLLNRLAQQVELQLGKRLSPGSFYGILKNQEEEVRQQAAIVLFEDYLARNFQLARATRSANRDEIEAQIARAINAAIKIVEMRLSRELASKKKRWSCLPYNQGQPGHIPHTSNRHLYPLPYHALRELALAALRKAVEQKRMSTHCADFANISTCSGGR